MRKTNYKAGAPVNCNAEVLIQLVKLHPMVANVQKAREKTMGGSNVRAATCSLATS